MKLSCFLTIGFMCLRQAPSFVVPPLSQRAGRAVSPRAQSLQRVGHAFSPRSHHSRRRQAKHFLSRMSESNSDTTADDRDPAVGAEAAVPLTMASPERKQEILDVLSAVIDPGE